MSEWAINVLRRIVRDLNVYLDGRNVSESALDTFVVSLELVYRDLIAQQLLNEQGVDDTNLNEGAQLVQTTLQMFLTLKEGIYISSSQPTQPTVSAAIGRPRFSIRADQLSFLVENRFTVPQMADMLGVSVRTVHRRLAERTLNSQPVFYHIQLRA